MIAAGILARSVAAWRRVRKPRGARILLYHSVKDAPTDPQLLSVSPANFRAQMEVVRSMYEPVTLEELVRQPKGSRSSRPRVAVTFDDGYSDNLVHAKAILNGYRIPGTVFVSTGYVGAAREFWYDELEQLLLLPGSLPERLHIDRLGDDSFDATLGSDAQYSDSRFAAFAGWNVLSDETPTARHSLYKRLFERLRQIDSVERGEALDALWSWAGRQAITRESHRPLTANELREMARDGSIVIGAHSVTHTMLSALPPMRQREEIANSREAISSVTGKRTDFFAYPYGGRDHYGPETVAMVAAEGFHAACSNFPGFVTRTSNPYELPRLLVRNWGGREFSKRVAVGAGG